MIECSRCKKNLSHLEKMGQENYMTAGYYSVKDSCWSKFANEGETHVCDQCMWKDPLYIKTYGDMNGHA